MVFDHEKEKARWQMEYDNIQNQKRELEDIISNLERRKDLLFKENERLKAEFKHNRSSIDGRSSKKGSDVGVPKLGLGLGLGGNLGHPANGLPPNHPGSAYTKDKSHVLKSKTGVLNQSTSSNKQPLGSNLNISLTSLNSKSGNNGMLPPQP